jgi:anaerobic selenocysteine-containing dehydrogenase
MAEKIRWIKTHCARLDHGGCGLLVGVKQNRIVKIKGDPDGYLNRGYICPKGLASADRLTHPNRLRYPLKRSGKRGEGKWKRISWDEALQTITERLGSIREKYGARSVAFCQGMPKGLEHFVLIRLAYIFGSPNVVVYQDVCHGPREITGLHTCGFYPVADFHHRSKLALLWGSNITSTNEEGEICSLLLDQIKSGTKLMVIDPRKTELADKAIHWLQIRPGTDNALALAFLNIIIQEELYDKVFVENWTHGFQQLATHVSQYTPEQVSNITWIAPDLIRNAARLYATSRPAAVQWGNAIEHNVNTFDTLRGMVSLMAVCGNLDVPGGNIQANDPEILGLGEFVRADLIPSRKKEMIHAHFQTIPRLMTVPPSYFKRAVLDEVPYPVKAAYFQCTNPLTGYANSRETHESLKKLDFLVVSDIFMTPTAAFADIVLPAATQFEFNDIGHYGLGHGYILARPKIVDPMEECWPDIKILNELGKSLTPQEYWYSDYEDMLDELLAPGGINYAQFVKKGYLKGEDRFRKYETAGFKTTSGRVELVLTKAEDFNVPSMPQFSKTPEADAPDYPLILISTKNPDYLHSSYRWIERLRKRSPDPVSEIHPDTAKELGIHEGEEVIIKTRWGEMRQIAHLTDRIHPKVVNAAYGWWFPEATADSQYQWKRSNFNMLTSTKRLGKEFGTPNLKGICCAISKG